MTLDEALYMEMIGDTEVSLLVGTRIHPHALRHGEAFPAITFLQVGSVNVRTLGNNRRCRRPRVQLDCWASKPSEARTVAEAVIAALDGFSGTLGGLGGLPVVSCLLQNDMALADPDPKLYRVMLEFEIVWEEA